MRRKQAILTASIMLVALLPGIGTLLGDRWWSINHLRFLPMAFTAGYAAALLAIFGILMRRCENRCATLVSNMNTIVFNPFGFRLIAIGATFATLFVVFRCQTFFLGDGYTITGLFSLGTDSIQKTTEWGATVVIWIVQSLLGAVSHETAEMAFQMISVSCGVVSLCLFRLIATRIAHTPAARILCFGALIGGGWMLLFFGYVEFYPLLWVSALAFIWSALRFLQSGRGFLWTILFFIVSCLMHLQAMYLLGGVLYLIAIRIKLSPATINRFFWPVVLTGTAAVIASIAWLYRRDVSYELIFLPLFTGRPLSIEYAILSPFHLGDIGQLFLLLVPAFIPLVTIRSIAAKPQETNSTTRFLIALAIGSALFLFIIDPVLGLGRDWDMFSLTLLAPTLLLLNGLRGATLEGAQRLILGAVFSGLVITTLFISASVTSVPSERRFHGLLRHYGTKERLGWGVLIEYLKKIDEPELAKSIIVEMNQRFPAFEELERGRRAMDDGNLPEAEGIASDLVTKNPFDVNALHFQAAVMRRKGALDSSVALYRRTLAIRPYAVTIWNEYGQVFLSMKQYDSAAAAFYKGRKVSRANTNLLEGLALSHYYRNRFDSALMIAESLRARDPHSPGASLTHLVVAVKAGDTATAIRSLAEFRSYGKGRSDYDNILKYFSAYLRE